MQTTPSYCRLLGGIGAGGRRVGYRAHHERLDESSGNIAIIHHFVSESGAALLIAALLERLFLKIMGTKINSRAILVRRT